MICMYEIDDFAVGMCHAVELILVCLIHEFWVFNFVGFLKLMLSYCLSFLFKLLQLGEVGSMNVRLSYWV
jgi:hypothetical protein